MQSAPLHFLIGLRYVTRSKRLRTTGQDNQVTRIYYIFPNIVLTDYKGVLGIRESRYGIAFLRKNMSENLFKKCLKEPYLSQY